MARSTGAVCAFIGSLLVLFMPRGTVGVGEDRHEGCRSGWLRYLNTCYIIQGGHVDWVTADKNCKQLGAKLATLTSYNHRNFVHSQIHTRCVDSVDECPEYANQGHCLKYHDYMAENCRFSCGFCASLCDDQDTNCMTLTYMGYCDNNDVLKRCRKACGCDGFGDHFWLQMRYEQSGLFIARRTGPYCYQLHTKFGLTAEAACDVQGGAGYICQEQVEKRSLPVADVFHAGCPVNGFGYKDKCYILNLHPTDWQDAESSCNTKNGTLASIPNLEVLEFVTSELLTEQTSSWIGLSKDTRGHYAWENGDKVAYLPWDTDYDGTDTGVCVELETSKNATVFNPDRCTRKQPSVCEIPRARPTGIPDDGDDGGQRSDVEFSDCSHLWTQHGQFCYKLFLEKKTWSDAQAYCENMTGDLMSIHDTDTQQVLDRFGQEEPVWIGLQKENRYKRYEWSDGSPFDYTSWDFAVSRDRLEGQCIQVENASRNWNGAPCQSTSSFICQIWRGHPPSIVMADGTTTPIPSSTPSHTTPAPSAVRTSSTAPGMTSEGLDTDKHPDTTLPNTRILSTSKTMPSTTKSNPATVKPNPPIMEPNPPIAKPNSPLVDGKPEITLESPSDVGNNQQRNAKVKDTSQEKKGGGSMSSGWPVSPEQIVGILLGCTVFVLFFSVAFVYASRNSRKRQQRLVEEELETKSDRSMSIKYEHRPSDGFPDEDIQAGSLFGASGPDDMPITFVRNGGEVDLGGGSMGFENQMYNMSTA